jgi:hypothetical protein
MVIEEIRIVAGITIVTTNDVIESPLAFWAFPADWFKASVRTVKFIISAMI